MITNFTKKYAIPTLLATCFLIFINSCKDNPHKIDVSDIAVSADFDGFYKKIQSYNKAETQKEFERFAKEYPAFFKAYYTEILNLEGYNDSSAPLVFKKFLEYEPTVEINNIVEKTFPSTQQYDEAITEAYKHYRYYFPNDSLPDIIYFTGILRYGTIYFGDKIGVGLDMYLGDAYPYNSIMDMPNYMIEKMKPEFITRNVMAVLATSRFEQFDKGKRFIDKMIYEGKIAYYLDAMLPNEHDSIKLALNGRDAEWCEKSEWQIWQHLVDPKLNVLYNTDQKIISRYFEDGPFTNANNVPPDSAPRFAVWTGREIVRKYMKNNPDVTLAELMQETDSDKILKDSKYKP